MFGGKKRIEPDGLLWQDESEEAGLAVDLGQGTTWETVCAWCLQEQGIAPNANDSHGICAYHSQQLLQSYRARKSR